MLADSGPPYEFDIEWHKFVLYQEDTRIFGLVYAIQGKEMHTLKRLPRADHRFISHFGSPLAKALPMHHCFDQGIDLEPGKTSLWGPIYSHS